MGDYTKAEPLYQQALAIRMAVLGKQHPHYAQSLNNLADLYHAMRDYDQSGTALSTGAGDPQESFGRKASRLRREPQ